MLFSSLEFLFFFLPVVLIGAFLLKTKQANYFLMVASLFFYAWGEPSFVWVMLGVILLDYLFARGIAARQNAGKTGKMWLVLAVVTNIGILFVYKYCNFATRNLASVFGSAIPVTSIVLPIGISFFLFQALSYVMDVYRRDTPVQKNPFYVCLYVSLFPQLIAGPIVRYTTVADEIATRTVTLDDYAYGVKRFIAGLSKKVLLANTFAMIADKAFPLAAEGSLSVAFSWLGIMAYTFQIFFDFSGYSDMAIGLGRMLGFHFLENFNYPYISKSISEFWRRWHISLGTWFRDYVYFPLGGSRVKSKARLVWNLLVVWGLTGLWHGAEWTFVVWGLMYFLFIAFEKISGYPQKFQSTAAKTIYRIFTLLCVVLGWVVFRAENMAQAGSYLRSMLGLAGNAFIDAHFLFYAHESAFFFVFAILCSVPFFPWLGKKLEAIPFFQKALPGLGVGYYLALFLLVVSYLVVGGHNPFIYFNF